LTNSSQCVIILLYKKGATMIDAYVLYIISYVLTGFGIIACLMIYLLAPKMVRIAFSDDEKTEETEKE